jgi:FtsH-binding integral membrane protein
MENNQFNLSGNQSYTVASSNVRTFMSNVFSWMFLALIVTSVAAWWFANDLSLLRMLVTEEGKMSILGWVVMLAPIGFVLLMSFAFNRLSYTTLIILFMTYAALVGISMSKSDNFKESLQKLKVHIVTLNIKTKAQALSWLQGAS